MQLSSDDAEMDPVTRFLPCGDTAVAVEFGDRADRRLSALVLAFADKVKAAGVAGIVEVVPTFRSLMIYYDPLTVAHDELGKRLSPLLAGLDAAEVPGRHWRIPVCYHESVAPDLGDVAERTGLAPDRVAECHASVTYHVYMVGFLPGFPYLGDLPRELVLPRRENPRTAVPAGSVAIATTQSSIYTLESPGGWHLIGRTPAPLWDPRSDPPAILAAGDRVLFQPVSLREYDELASRRAAGALRLEPEEAGPRA